MRPAGGIGALGDGRLLLAARQLRGDQRCLRRSVRRPAEHPRRGIRPRSAVHRTPVRPRRRHAADPRRPRIPDPGEGGRSRAARRPRHAGSDPFGHRDLAHERRGAGGQHRRSPGETLADGAGFPSFRTAAARRIGSGTAVRAGQSRLRSRGGPLPGARGAEGGSPVAVRRSQQTDGRRRSQHTPPRGRSGHGA